LYKQLENYGGEMHHINRLIESNDKCHYQYIYQSNNIKLNFPIDYTYQ